MAKQKNKTPLITLITDFGYQDEYVGVMKGIIYSINPDIRIVDITHSIPPQDIRSASFILFKAYRYFPKGTVHLVVVDPGVGSERDALIVESKDYFFVAPDNGVLSLAIDEDYTKIYRIISKKPKSTTFHGRDIFAPVAAELASAIPVNSLSEKKSSLVKLPFLTPKKTEYGLAGEVVYIDHFGNAITNIKRSLVEATKFIVETKNCKIERISESYKGKSPSAIWGSSDLLELSVPNDSFVNIFNVKIGDIVILKFPK